jgi:hypothetical protein
VSAERHEAGAFGGHDLPDGAADLGAVAVGDVECSPLPEPGCDHAGRVGLEPAYRVGCRSLQLIKHGVCVCVGFTEEVGANPPVNLLIVGESAHGQRDHSPPRSRSGATGTKRHSTIRAGWPLSCAR